MKLHLSYALPFALLLCGGFSSCSGRSGDKTAPIEAKADSVPAADSAPAIPENETQAEEEKPEEPSMNVVVIVENPDSKAEPEWVDTLAVTKDGVFARSSLPDFDASFLHIGEIVLIDNPIISCDSISPKVYRVSTLTDTLEVNVTKQADLEALQRLNAPIAGFVRTNRGYHWGNDSYLYRVDMPQSTVEKAVEITQLIIDMLQENVNVDSKLPKRTPMLIASRPMNFTKWTYTGNIWNRDSIANFFANRYFASLLAENEEEQPEWVNSAVADIRPVISNGELLTVQKFDYDYSGGAHGMYVENLFSYDMANGNVVNCDRIFTEEGAEQVKIALLKEIASDQHYNYWCPVEDWEDALRKMTSESYDGENGSSSLADFKLPCPALSKSGVMFSYQPYDIAPYAAGAFHYVIPYAAIYEWLTPDGKRLVDSVYHFHGAEKGAE